MFINCQYVHFIDRCRMKWRY